MPDRNHNTRRFYRIADSEPLHQVEAAEGGVLASSARWLSPDILRNDNLSRFASTNPSGTTATNVTSQSIIPQLAASSLGTAKRRGRAAMVASSQPTRTPGDLIWDTTSLEPINSTT